MAPIAPGGQIAEKQFVLQAKLDGRDSPGDLSGHEGFAARRTFVIEQNAVRRVHAIGFAVIDGDPIGIKLRRGVRRERIKRRRLPLRHFLDKAVKLRRRGLIKPHFLLQVEDTDGLKKPQRAKRVGVRGVFRRLE